MGQGGEDVRTAEPPYCDLVMKGGVTSGIIYPPVACKLKDLYWFRNIGGTSAGAIAAGATAAAELGRRSGNSQSYVDLADLPDQVAGNRLLELFRPDRATRGVFRFLLDISRARGVWGKLFLGVVAIAKATTWWLWFLFVAGLAVFTVALITIAGGRASLAVWILVVVWGLPWLGIVLIASGARLAYRTAAMMPANFYGLCTGCAPPPRRAMARLYARVRRRKLQEEYSSLTVWLYELYNKLAGLNDLNQPLVFEQLWTAKRTAQDVLINGRIVGERVINLEMMTTDITRGRPYRLPFELYPPASSGSNGGLPVPPSHLYFCEEDWKHLFPCQVIEWLKCNADPTADPVERVRPVRGGCDADLIALPPPARLPVIVAVRMSLSFPLLLSAVPLYAIDKTLPENKPPKARYRAERVWFSDGGISSNFPIHFFDDPLPRWPTFGIDLVTPRERPDGKDPLTPWVAGKDTPSLTYWNRFDRGGAAPGSLAGFLRAIINAMQNWHDNLQAEVPGYLDRIVHVPLEPNEGGLNLTMGACTVRALARRGADAADILRDVFHWTNHAWVRYRSMMNALEDFLTVYRDGYRDPIPGDENAWDLINGRSTAYPSYPWGPVVQSRAAGATRDLMDFVLYWKGLFQDNAPEPPPELRVAPGVWKTRAG